MNEHNSQKPEEQKVSLNLSINKKTIKMILASLLVIFLIGAGYLLGQKDNSNTTKSIERKTATEEQEIKIPKEAREFVEKYNHRYADLTIPTYYADKAYREAHDGKSLILTDEYINNYVPIEVKGGTIPHVSELGFTYLEVPKAIKADGENIVTLFNGYMGPSLELYLNLAAKNPDPRAIEIIDTEFINYCSSGNLSADDEYMNNLIATAKKIASRNGSDVNYEIVPLTSDIAKQEDQNLSYILPSPDTWEHNWYKNQSTMALSDVANRVAINTYQYDSSENIQKDTITAYGLDMTYILQVSPASVSRVSLGAAAIPQIYPKR